MNAIPTPDHLVCTTPSPVSTTTIASGHVDVNWMDGKSHRFHPFWLCDNCACADCLHQATREQLLDIRQVPLDIVALSVSCDDEGAVTVCFSDGQESRYHPGWLWFLAEQSWALVPLESIYWIQRGLTEPPLFDGPSAKPYDAVENE